MFDFEQLESFVKTTLHDAERGHDYWHAYRVVQNAVAISQQEGGDVAIIKAAAWVHDILDEKFSKTCSMEHAVSTKLCICGFSETQILTILHIVSHISFKGGFSKCINPSLEFKIVQDADRLDAIGAIGIARAFQYGGYKNREMYNPAIPPQTYADAQEYRNSKSHTINHFYEKLFTLHTTMQTSTAKQIALQRHEYMKQFVAQFFSEWHAKDV